MEFIYIQGLWGDGSGFMEFIYRVYEGVGI